MNKTNIFYDEAKQNILWWRQKFYEGPKKKPYKEKYIEIITLISL